MITPEQARKMAMNSSVPQPALAAHLLYGGSTSPPFLSDAMPVKAKAEVRETTDEEKLNKTERAYLAYLRAIHPDAWIGVQNITLKLAFDCRLTPDFVIVYEDGSIEMVDVKGFQREDALIKMKIAARLFPWATFTIASRSDVGWSYKVIKP